MQWSWCGRATVRAAAYVRPGVLLAAACAVALAACNPDDHTPRPSAQPRGATVAFESIDGLPPGQFQKLVQDLNNEAQTRRLAVMSRESPSAYRVRGYLAAKVVKHRDHDFVGLGRVRRRRPARAAHHRRGNRQDRHRDAWAVADDAMLHRIARSSMDQLAAFLTSPEVAPGTPDSEPRLALAGAPDSSPEAAGIFRIFQAKADPADEPPKSRWQAGPVPLPPPRPPVAAAISGPGHADAGGGEPLNRLTSFTLSKSFGTTVWTRIASPSPPCYDLRACAHDPETWAPVFGNDHA